MRDQLIVLIEEVAIDGASHAGGAQIEIATSVAAIVAPTIQYHVVAARAAQETTEAWLADNATCIHAQLAIATREVANRVAFKARHIRKLNLAVKRRAWLKTRRQLFVFHSEG